MSSEQRGLAPAGMVADALHQRVPVVEQVELARDTLRLRLACPEIARQAVPGQFFMVRAPGQTDPLLGRPFALYDTWLDAQGEPAGIDIVYLVLGKMTGVMRRWKPGDHCEIWGPLGNGFSPVDAGRLVMVAGGIGQTPFLAVAREALGLRRYGSPARAVPRRPERVVLCYGARSAEYLAGLDDFGGLDLDLQLSTDNGTRGHHGFVTDLLLQELAAEGPAAAIYCCGPEPMMKAVSRMAAQQRVPCWLSLETPMACGFGACFSCVTRVKQDGGDWDYRRVCVEGPIFNAASLVLD